MTATLYAIPGSHAVRTGALMLEHKGIDYRRVDFPPGLHRVLVRLRGFPGDRVPAVVFDGGRRAQGTRELPRVLDELRPEPRLTPDDPRGLEAERWADEVLQQWARRMVASTGARDPDALAGRGAGGRLGPLLTKRGGSRRAVARMVLLAFGVTKEQRRDDRERTPEILDRVDAWIADGVLNGPELRAPDFAIASSLALVEYIYALKPEIQRRPLGALVERVFSGGSGAARGPA
jgi:glutathione S-transferase